MVYTVIPPITPATRTVHCRIIALLIPITICVLMSVIMIVHMIRMETYSVGHVFNPVLQINTLLLIPIHDYVSQGALSQPSTPTLSLTNVLHLVPLALYYLQILLPSHVFQIAPYILKDMDTSLVEHAFYNAL